MVVDYINMINKMLAGGKQKSRLIFAQRFKLHGSSNR